MQVMHGPEALPLIPQQPQQLPQLDDINSWVYDDIANGAYKAGFASSQLAYETAYKKFFAALDRVEALLQNRRWVTYDYTTLHSKASKIKIYLKTVQI